MLKPFLFAALALELLFLAGCEAPISPTANNLGIPPGAKEGEYGYYIDTSHFDNTFSGSASIYPNVAEASEAITLRISLDAASSDGTLYGDIFLTVPMRAPKSQTFQFSDANSLWNPYAIGEADFFSNGWTNYRSIPGGTLTITKFDTINNLVSGTFEFQAYEINPTINLHQDVSVSYGYFNDIPIAEGSYGQGTISALLNGIPFISDTAGLQMVYGDSEFDGIALFDNGQGSFLNSYISIQRIPLRTGTYMMDSSTARTDTMPIIIYQNWENEQQNASTQSPGSSGTLTITSCDVAHRRISGTFQFSGVDSLGNTVSITNGVINNVQWEP